MKTITLLLLSTVSFAALATELETRSAAETRSWIELQISGKQAASGPRPMPGEIASNVYQRYVDSFKQPIPAEFKRQSTESGGEGSK